MNYPLRILIISDLHFSGQKDDGIVDDKFQDEFLRIATAEDRIKEFFKSLHKVCRYEDNWPRAVIVAGDLVKTGGQDPEEFNRSTEFLRDLVSEFNLGRHVYVVPGNHDVNWKKGLTYLERFESYLTSTERFTSPTITNSRLCAKFTDDPSQIIKGVNVELLLLVSPTFSGVITKETNKFITDVRDAFLKSLPDGIDSEPIDKVLKEIEDGRAAFDIAAIGANQRNQIALLGERHRAIRPILIAILHHHLLPDPAIEIFPFESVLDSGKVLEDLISSGFDLVISGHKHNHRLTQYRIRDSSIDIYSAPSLF
jgi:3',5'-cyclic AMP phosphodiesterase CpdA